MQCYLVPPALGPSPCCVRGVAALCPPGSPSHRRRRRWNVSVRIDRAVGCVRSERERVGVVRKPAIEGARAHVRVCLQRLGLRCDLRRMPIVAGAGVGVVACAQVPPKRSIGGRSAIRRTSQHNVRCRWPQSRRSTCTAAGAVQRCRERSGTAYRGAIVIRQVRECSARTPCAQSKRVPTLCIRGLG